MSKFGSELEKHKTNSIKEDIKNSMDEESYKDFLSALTNESVPASAIVQALKSFNVEVSENTIRRWRKASE